MIFEVLTIFPDMVESAFRTGVTGRASGEGIIELDTVNIREYSTNSYGSIDGYTYGGGAGMLMQCEPVYQAYEEAVKRLSARRSTPEKDDRIKTRVIYMTPVGEVFTQDKAKELAEENELIFLCGHYEGIDERVIDETLTESFNTGGLLEYPQYTRPDEWHGKKVPEILLSGDHAKVENYRMHEMRRVTKEIRPDLYTKYMEERGIF